MRHRHLVLKVGSCDPADRAAGCIPGSVTGTITEAVAAALEPARESDEVSPPEVRTDAFDRIVTDAGPASDLRRFGILSDARILDGDSEEICAGLAEEARRRALEVGVALQGDPVEVFRDPLDRAREHFETGRTDATLPPRPSAGPTPTLS